MKIFASDLDGTLLNKNYQSDEHIDACIKNIVNHQNQFVVVTGRSINGIMKLPFIQYASYLIVMNGAILLDNKFKILNAATIKDEIISAIFKQYQYDNVEYISDKFIYMTISKEEYLKEYSKWELWQKKMRSNADIEHHLSVFKFNSKLEDLHDIVKINILELDSIRYKEKETYIHQFDSMIDNQPFDIHVLEITSKNISKLNALKYLCQSNNWCEEDIYVFGDGGNDVEMLSYFNHSYAPCNASNEAIKAAKEVIEANDNYGVCNKIESLMRNQTKA